MIVGLPNAFAVGLQLPPVLVHNAVSKVPLVLVRDPRLGTHHAAQSVH